MRRWRLNEPGAILAASLLAVGGCAASSPRTWWSNRHVSTTASSKAIAATERQTEHVTADHVAGNQSSGAVKKTSAAPLKAVSYRTPVQSSVEPLHTAPVASSVEEPVNLPEPIVYATEPINLSSALAMTSGQNPEVQFARQRIVESYGLQQAANTAWLPSIRAGANYNKHEGRIQDVAGQIIETSRGSVYTGLGSQAVGAGSPAVPGLLMNFHLSDAIFQPRIAGQTVAARRDASRAVVNDELTETAVAYIDLLQSLQRKAVLEQTYLRATSLARLTSDFAEAGQGLRADADRAQVELSFRAIELHQADEAIRIASIRLAQQLRADSAVTLLPVESHLVPIDLVAVDQPLAALVSTGLQNRPELSEARHLVRAAIDRYDREKYAPFVPSVLLGMSYGGNGGGLGSDIERFGDRLDFDAAAWWEVRQLGHGEEAARNIACSRVEQAKWQQVRLMDQVAAEVSQAYTQVVSQKQQLALAQAAITAAEDSYRRNGERIQNGQGLPIEVMQSLQALDQAQHQYNRIVADYNRAQFRLQRALGWPVDAVALPVSESVH